MKEKAIEDLDNTLFYDSVISKLLKKLSRFFFRLSFRFQFINKNLSEVIEKNDITILTGRNEDLEDITRKELERFGVEYKLLLLCPRKDIIMEWKQRNVKSLKQRGYTHWYDDGNG